MSEAAPSESEASPRTEPRGSSASPTSDRKSKKSKKEKKGKKDKKDKKDKKEKKKKDEEAAKAKAADERKKKRPTSRPEAVPVEVKGAEPFEDAEFHLNLVVTGDNSTDLPGLLGLYASGVPLKTSKKKKDKKEKEKEKEKSKDDGGGGGGGGEGGGGGGGDGGGKKKKKKVEEKVTFTSGTKLGFLSKIVGTGGREEVVKANVTLSYENQCRAAHLVDADGVLLCYTPVSVDSFDRLKTDWLPTIEKYTKRPDGSKAPIALCATRLDLLSKFMKKKLEVIKVNRSVMFAEEHQMLAHSECSARHNKGVKHAIESIVALIIRDKRKLPNPPVTAADKEIQRIKDLRTSVKSAKSMWVCKWVDQHQRFYYMNRATKEFLTERPEDFDGIDFKGTQEQEVKGKELAEVQGHSEAVEQLQTAAMQVSAEIGELNAQMHELQREQARQRRLRALWSDRPDAVRRAAAQEAALRADEEFVDSEERQAGIAQVTACRESMREVLEAAPVAAASTFKQKEQANQQLRQQLAELQAERRDGAARLEKAHEALDSGEKQVQRLRGVIEKNKAAHEAALAEETRLNEEIKDRVEQRMKEQQLLIREKEAERLKTAHAQAGLQEAGNLLRAVDKLELDIMRNHGCDAASDGRSTEALQAELAFLVEAKNAVAAELAATCATGVTAFDRLTDLRNRYVAALADLDEECRENDLRVASALALPARIVHIFTRHAEKLAGDAARHTRDAAAVRRTLAALDAEDSLDVSDVMRTAPRTCARPSRERAERRLADAIERRRTAQRQRYVLGNRAEVCSMEHDYLLRLQVARAEDRVAHAAVGRQLVAEIDSVVETLLGASSPWAAALPPALEGAATAAAAAPRVSLALLCSNGLLQETRVSLVASESFVLRRRERKRRAKESEAREYQRMLRFLDSSGDGGSRAAARQQRAAAGSPLSPGGASSRRYSVAEAPVTSERIRSFAFASNEIRRDVAVEKAHKSETAAAQRLPRCLTYGADDVDFPTKYHHPLAYNKTTYATTASSTWLRYTREASVSYRA